VGCGPYLYSMRYRFIAIEGNIGAGKTTLAMQLAAHYGARLLLEQFADNPFLPMFYEDRQRHALPVELSFLTDRLEQLQALFAMPGPGLTVADYALFKSRLFAGNNLEDAEFRLYQRIHDLTRKALPKPDLILYLHTPVERLQQQIRERGRPYEQHITAVYLEEIERAYENYFKTYDEGPLLRIDNDRLDLSNAAHFDSLVTLLESPGPLPPRWGL